MSCAPGPNRLASYQSMASINSASAAEWTFASFTGIAFAAHRTFRLLIARRPCRTQFLESADRARLARLRHSLRPCLVQATHGSNGATPRDRLPRDAESHLS